MENTVKIPTTLGACADRLYALRQKKSDAQKVVDALTAEEAAIKEHIIQTLPKNEASGVAGKMARVSIVTKTVASVKDWDAFHKYVKRTGAFELLQRRVGDAAIKERWEAGKVVPGVEPFNVVSVSLVKV